MSGELAYLGFAEAAELIRAKKLSPVEYATALLARIERHDGKYNAFIALTPERALHILDGTATLEIVREDGPQSFALRAGMIAVIPQGGWHRFQSSEGVTLMTATPSPSEVIELDVDDPRTVERKPA